MIFCEPFDIPKIKFDMRITTIARSNNTSEIIVLGEIVLTVCLVSPDGFQKPLKYSVYFVQRWSLPQSRTIYYLKSP